MIVPKSFLQPIPASQARSQAQQIIDANREQVERYTGQSRRELVRILVRTQKQLEERLADEVRRRGGDTWTANDVEATLVRVRFALSEMGPRFRRLLAENDARARQVGARNTSELLAHFEGRAGRGVVQGGVLRPLGVQAAMVAQRPELLRHATSVDRYGTWMIGVIRRELQAGIVRGATFEEMTTALVGKRGPRGIVSMAARETASRRVVRTRQEAIAEGLFVRYRGWPERIVRTEGMMAMNGAACDEITRRAPALPGLSKKLVATFDRRTAADSRAVHGQVRAIGEPFRDPLGREYMYPPNRPNDREVVIPWRAVWAGDLASIGIGRAPQPPRPVDVARELEHDEGETRETGGASAAR